MKIIRCKNYHDLSHRAIQIMLSRIEEQPDLLLCAATGNTPKGAYKKLGRTAKTRDIECSAVKLLQLDEWVSLSADHEASCQFQLQQELVKPLEINEFYGINGDSIDIEGEIEKVNGCLEKLGPIDLCILGLGLNGHLGFNEPADNLADSCHKTVLSEESMRHAMVDGINPVPTEGITLGLKQILESRQIVLLVSGDSKRGIFEELINSKERSSLPASYLLNHPNTICLVDQEAYPKA